MKILIGSDHGGYALKEKIKKALDKNEIKYVDYGCNSESSVDYPKVAKEVCEDIVSNPRRNLGILVCGTGIGMSMVANKFRGIRAALCHNDFTAQMAREHNNANVLCIGGRVVSATQGMKIVRKFIETPFSNEERHKRRINMI